MTLKIKRFKNNLNLKWNILTLLYKKLHTIKSFLKKEYVYLMYAFTLA